MWRNVRRNSLAALLLVYITCGTNAATGHEISPSFECRIKSGWVDTISGSKRIVIAANGKILWDAENQRGTPVGPGMLARYLDNEAQSYPKPIIELASEDPKRPMFMLFSLMRAVRDHGFPYIWIDSYHSSTPPMPIWCANDKAPTSVPAIALTLSDDGKMNWNGEPVGPEQLKRRLEAALLQVPQPSIHVKFGRETSVLDVTNVLWSIQVDRFEWMQLETD